MLNPAVILPAALGPVVIGFKPKTRLVFAICYSKLNEGLAPLCSSRTVRN
jgi:hypothetical protein